MIKVPDDRRAPCCREETMGLLGKKGIIVAVVVVLIGLFFVFDLHHFLTLAELKTRQEAFHQF
ncbi:MAG: hypothetical protein K0B09_15150, partial [Bacteroidales bacterium]|nr:hypothetical protein [Bacteroidales bacterium]